MPLRHCPRAHQPLEQSQHVTAPFGAIPEQPADKHLSITTTTCHFRDPLRPVLWPTILTLFLVLPLAPGCAPQVTGTGVANNQPDHTGSGSLSRVSTATSVNSSSGSIPSISESHLTSGDRVSSHHVASTTSSTAGFVSSSAAAATSQSGHASTSTSSVQPSSSHEGTLTHGAIHYHLDQPGRVSLAVYGSDGKLLRELMRGQTHQPGDHQVQWDGLTAEGDPVTPGTYQWRLLRTPGFKAEYITSLGINPGTVPYDSWVGTGTGVISVAADPSGVYVAAEATETAPVLLKVTTDGTTRIWTRTRGDVTLGRFQGGASLASNGQGLLYMLHQNGYLQVIETASGTKQDTWDVLEPKDPAQDRDLLFVYTNTGDAAPADMDAWGDTVVMSYRDFDMIRWLDSSNHGAVIATVTVPEPSGVAVASDTDVYVLSNGQLLAASQDGSTRVIAGDQSQTGRLAVKHHSGNILVAERGPRHQVRMYSPDGTLLHTFGREGGRRPGRYVPQDFLDITDISADGIGGFLIAEGADAPRRYAHVTGNGDLVNEWYGAQDYYSWGEPDPRDPSKVWFASGVGLVLAQIDFTTGRWQVRETYPLHALGGGLVRAPGTVNRRWRVLYRNNQRYLFSAERVQVLAHQEGLLRAVTILGAQDLVPAAAALAGYTGQAQAFRWLDGNEDGIPQADEFTWSNVPGVTVGHTVTDDFEVLEAANTSLEGEPHFAVHSTQPTWTDHGPLYPIGEEPGRAMLKGQTRSRGSITTGGVRGAGVFRDRAGNYYGAFNGRADCHGDAWFTVWGGQSRVVKWNADGTEQWRVGRHAIHGGLADHSAATPPGQLHVPAAFAGEIRDTVVLSDRVEWPTTAWTKDGLYAGSFLEGRVDDGLPDIVYHWWRTPDGTEAILTSDHGTSDGVIETAGGEVLWFTQGRNNVVVYRVHGWDGWTHLQGHLVITASPVHATRQGSGLTAAYFPAPDTDGLPSATREETQVWHGIPPGKPYSDEVVDGQRGEQVYDWSVEIGPLGARPASGFGVRWTGQVETPLSEPFVFSVYGRGGKRLWLDGEQVIFAWNEGLTRWVSAPIQLRAGERHDIQLDFYSTHPAPAASLNWESPTIDRQRIPTAYLHPQMDRAPNSQPSLRAATSTIDAQTFDHTNIPATNPRDYTLGVRQRGLGKSGSYLGYDRIDFGTGVSALRVRASGQPAGTGVFDVVLSFRLGSATGQEIGSLHMNQGDAVPEHVVPLTQSVQGEQEVYVVNATPEKWHYISLSWFLFQ